MKGPPKKKASGAGERCEADSKDDTCTVDETGEERSALSAVIEALQSEGFAVHRLTSGAMLICRWGHSFHALDAFAAKGFLDRVRGQR